MDNSEIVRKETSSKITKLPILAAIVALVGLADSIYLTIHHYTAEPVPCSIITGCEQVLTSSYAEVAGIPLAIFGAVAYLTAFVLAILSAYGNRLTWTLFGLQVVIMSLFSGWLLYVQGFILEAFCQFCLISAATTFTLLILFITSKFIRVK